MQFEKSFQHFVDSRGREGAKVIVVEIEVTVFISYRLNCNNLLQVWQATGMSVLGGLRFAWPSDARNPQVGIPHLRVSHLCVRIERYGCLRAFEAASLRVRQPSPATIWP